MKHSSEKISCGDFKALRKIGYQGWMALECGLSGPADEVLPRSVEYLRECLIASV